MGDLQIECKQDKVTSQLTVDEITLPTITAETEIGYAVRLELIGPARIFNQGNLENGSSLGLGENIFVWRQFANVSKVTDLKVKLTNDAYISDTISLKLTIYNPNGTTQNILVKQFDVVDIVGFERRKVNFFNPASNTTQFSLLRLINDSSDVGVVRIKGIDDGGKVSSVVEILIPANSAIQVTSEELERGSSRVVGALGRGSGKWRLYIDSDFVGLTVQSLVRNNSTGTISTVSDVVQ